VLGVVDYRGRLARGQKSADAFAEAQQAKMRLRRRNPEQKELLGSCMFDADRAGAVALRAVPTQPVAVAGTPAQIATQPDVPQTQAAAHPPAPPQAPRIGSGGDR
jgi:hypothetical protein